QLQQIIPTRLFAPESGLQFGQGSGIVFHTQYHNILGLLESNKYPIFRNLDGIDFWAPTKEKTREIRPNPWLRFAQGEQHAGCAVHLNCYIRCELSSNL
ncbi:MAG TPA: hypothetical protein VKG65_03130, partial [Terriglobales bacterium]|nr:hypothetical protein [Terriglobales bacterium]